MGWSFPLQYFLALQTRPKSIVVGSLTHFKMGKPMLPTFSTKITFFFFFYFSFWLPIITSNLSSWSANAVLSAIDASKASWRWSRAFVRVSTSVFERGGVLSGDKLSWKQSWPSLLPKPWSSAFYWCKKALGGVLGRTMFWLWLLKKFRNVLCVNFDPSQHPLL